MKGFVIFTLLLVLCGNLISEGHEMSGMKNKSDKKLEMEAVNPVEFTTLEDASMYAKDGNAVLFFNATWCPSCRAVTKDLNTKASSLNKGTTVIMVDYDKYKDLKVKYGVYNQHTFVQIDSMGKKLKIWNGGSIKEINKQTSTM